MKKITLFCDGSSLGNPGAGGWCAILCYGNNQKVLQGGARAATNNQMELRAAIEGIKALKEPCDITLKSDSQYVCRGINEWLAQWKMTNFKGKKNKELWLEYEASAKPHKIRAVWIRGHSNIEENEECDRVAKMEAAKWQRAESGGESSPESRAESKPKNASKNAVKGESSAESKNAESKAQKTPKNPAAPQKSQPTQKIISPAAQKHTPAQKSPAQNPQPTPPQKSANPPSQKSHNNRAKPISSAEAKAAQKALEKRLAYKFKDPALLRRAITHKSYNNSHNNERLEFLGDAVLDLLIGDYLFKKMPTSNEGVLTKLRSSLVNESSLAKLARAIDLGESLLIAPSEIRNNGRSKPSLLSSALEAIFGAIYLDSGLESARELCYRLLEGEYEEISIERLFKDYKTLLQELTQRLWGVIPEYVLVDSSGPEHDKRFTMKALIKGTEFARESGKSKKEAEQACAMSTFRILKRDVPDEPDAEGEDE